MSYASVFTAFKRIFELKRLSSNDDRSNKGKDVFFREEGEVCTSPLLLLLSTDSMSGKRLAAMLLGVMRACTLALPNRQTMSYASVFTAFKRLFELKRLSSSDD